MTASQWSLRVYYEDTDAGGVVYHTNYIKYFERARTEWLRTLGFSQAALSSEAGVVFSVVSLTTRFHLPARLDDELIVRTHAKLAGGASVNFKQEIRRQTSGEELLASGEILVACVDATTFKPRRLPELLRKELT
ncbi:MAG: tol-pal system-associated acyl-CoA thioesterase [Pseudomonadota bacterium]